MHFWIDKRSQTCGFSGRHRVPASLSAGGGCGQQRRRRRRRSREKPMVTPVHRFQPVECVQQQQHHHHPPPPLLHPGHGQVHRRQLHHRQLHSCLPPPHINGLTSPPGASVRSVGPHAVELDSSVFLDLPLDGTGNDNIAHNIGQPQLLPVGRFKCGLWASIVLALVFVVGAKFYFDHQGTGLEVLVICALLVVFLLAFCTVSVCRSKATRDLLTAAVTTQPPPHSTTSFQQQGQSHNNEQLEVLSTEDIGLNQIISQPNALIFSPVAGPPQSPITAPEPPPPPYHIAILLPQQVNDQAIQANEESPPPSYDKVVT